MLGLGVVRRNPEFGRVWAAQLVSQGGDWLSRMAVLSLIRELGGGAKEIGAGIGLLFGIELATRLMPTALMSPFAGPLADRVSRRAIMISTDLLRFALVLCLLLIREPAQLPYLYAMVALQMSLGMFFDSARSATVASLVPKEELHEAYALTAMTWSMMLSIGALAGGLLVDWVGIDGVFILDSFTYILSALLLWKLRLPKTEAQPKPFSVVDTLTLRDMREALAHVRSLGLLPVVSAKSFWGAAGGFLVLLSVAADLRVGGTPSAGDSAMGAGTAVGLLYFARGLGTGIGPLLAKRLTGSHDRALMHQISAGFLFGAGGYLLFSFTSDWYLSLLCIIVAHMGGSTLWVASTTLWQKHVEDRYRGRVFALDFFGMTLSFTLGALLIGGLYDLTESLQQALWAASGGVLCMGSLWSYLAHRRLDPAPQEPPHPLP